MIFEAMTRTKIEPSEDIVAAFDRLATLGIQTLARRAARYLNNPAKMIELKSGVHFNHRYMWIYTRWVAVA